MFTKFKILSASFDVAMNIFTEEVEFNAES